MQDALAITEGAKVYDHDGDTDQPPVAVILVVGDTIAAIEAGLGAGLRRGEGPAAIGGKQEEGMS